VDDTATVASDQLRDGHRQAEQAIRSLHDEWFDASAANQRSGDPTTGLAATELTP
jgi:hypothetical protein